MDAIEWAVHPRPPRRGKCRGGNLMGNPVVHFDISGPDPEQLQTFYGELFGWKVIPVPEMNYALVDTQGGSGINGGIGASREGPGLVAFYVMADDLQAVLDKAEALGGKTTQP